MGDSAAFKPLKPGTRISDHVDAGPCADRPEQGQQVNRRRPPGGLLRPSQVPVSGSTSDLFRSLSGVRGDTHFGLQFRPSGLATGAPLSLARPSTVPIRPVQDVLRAPGQPLSSPVKEEMEAGFGADFSDVRLHADTAARASASAVGARAYTSGNHVVTGATGVDDLTLAHELAHVIQQREGPVSGTDDGSGLILSNPSDRFERAAEAAAEHAVRGTLQRLGDDASDGRLPPAHRPASPGPSAGTPAVLAAQTSASALERRTLGGGQPFEDEQSDLLKIQQGPDFHQNLTTKGNEFQPGDKRPFPHQHPLALQLTTENRMTTRVLQRIVTKWPGAKPKPDKQRDALITHLGVKPTDQESLAVIDAVIRDSKPVEFKDVAAMLPPPRYIPSGALETTLGTESEFGFRPLGFGSVEDFQLFIHKIYSSLVSDAVVVFHGSSLTGQSFKDKGVGSRLFDIGRDSDYDVAIVSPTLWKTAPSVGVKIRGDHSEPLEAAQIKALGLDKAFADANFLARREVNFMLYESVEQARQHEGPALVTERNENYLAGVGQLHGNA